MPYVFYDTETTGTETAFDQILQFAAIKTDDDLNELDRFNIFCSFIMAAFLPLREQPPKVYTAMMSGATPKGPIPIVVRDAPRAKRSGWPRFERLAIVT